MRRRSRKPNKRFMRRYAPQDILMDGLPNDEESPWDPIDQLPEWVIAQPSDHNDA